MELTCGHCGEDYMIDNKKYGRRLACDKIHKMSTCPLCGEKNTYNIIQRYIAEERIEKQAGLDKLG